MATAAIGGAVLGGMSWASMVPGLRSTDARILARM
ncbi:MAG: hypothetical protein ACYC3X_26985 [Pirellulaceae bacterium]